MFTFSVLQRITGGKLSCFSSNLNLTTARSKMKLVVMLMSKNNNRYLDISLTKGQAKSSIPIATGTESIHQWKVTAFAS